MGTAASWYCRRNYSGNLKSNAQCCCTIFSEIYYHKLSPPYTFSHICAGLYLKLTWLLAMHLTKIPFVVSCLVILSVQINIYLNLLNFQVPYESSPVISMMMITMYIDWRAEWKVQALCYHYFSSVQQSSEVRAEVEMTVKLWLRYASVNRSGEKVRDRAEDADIESCWLLISSMCFIIWLSKSINMDLLDCFKHL